MSPRRRTVLLSALSVAGTGCLGGTGADVPTRPSGETPVRTREPVRTDGEPTTAETAASDETLVNAVRAAVSERADCITGDVPGRVHSEGVVLTTRTVVRSVDDGDIAFPSPAYYRVREVTPRTVLLDDESTSTETTSSGSTTQASRIPVFIRAVLEEGPSERIVPEMDGDC